MKEQIKEELEKWKKIYSGLGEQLSNLILADIILTQSNISKTKEGNIENISFEQFDKNVEGIKNMLKGLTTEPEIDLKESVTQTIEDMKRIENECLIAIRTLDWVNSLEEKERKDA